MIIANNHLQCGFISKSQVREYFSTAIALALDLRPQLTKLLSIFFWIILLNSKNYTVKLKVNGNKQQHIPKGSKLNFSAANQVHISEKNTDNNHMNYTNNIKFNGIILHFILTIVLAINCSKDKTDKPKNIIPKSRIITRSINSAERKTKHIYIKSKSKNQRKKLKQNKTTDVKMQKELYEGFMDRPMIDTPNSR
jgi:hypothetical protein